MNIGEQVVRLIATSLTRGFQYIKRHLDAVQTFLIVFALIALAFIAWQSYSKTEIVLLAGPKGGTADRYSDLIAKSLDNQSSWFKRSYRVRKVVTDGFEENRKRVEADSSGLVFAFAHDGFGESSNIRTLLPLKKSLLHVICRNGFCDQLKLDKQPRSFMSIAAALSPNGDGQIEWKKLELPRPPRIFPGPPESGTRQMARVVLDYYQVPYEDYATYGLTNWDDMRLALRMGDLDLAFYLGPPNSKIVNQIARDGQCCLVSIEEADAIVQGHEQVVKESLKPNSYVPGDVFCPGGVTTIASRRVLICSRQMETTTGYALAVGTRDALRQFIPHLDWSAISAEEKPEPGLSYLLHPSAEFLSMDRVPGTTNWIREQVRTWWPVLASVVAAAIASFLSWANKRLPESPPESEVQTSSADQGEQTYDGLSEQVRNALEKLVKADVGLAGNDYRTWEQTIAELRDGATTAHDQGRISHDEFEILLQGVRELRAELQFFHKKERAKKKAGAVDSG